MTTLREEPATQRPNLAVELRGIRKSYGSNHVLRDLALSIETGRFHVLVGCNGAGKSTLLRILGRREPPDAGQGFLLGRSIADDLVAHNREVAYVSESTDYAIPLTMRDFFCAYPKIQPGWQSGPFEASMRTLGIDLDKAFSALSRGQRMQVACAAALAGKPRLVLFDEVTSVLDARARPYFVDALVEFCRGGGTVLMATNLVSEVRYAADRLLLVDEGAIRVDVAVPELSERFVRIVRSPGSEHAVFASPACVPIGRGEDDRPRCLVPRDDPAVTNLPNDIVDPRKVTPEEAFIYFTARSG